MPKAPKAAETIRVMTMEDAMQPMACLSQPQPEIQGPEPRDENFREAGPHSPDWTGPGSSIPARLASSTSESLVAPL